MATSAAPLLPLAAGTAAAHHAEIRAHALRAKDWQRLEQQLGPETTAPETAPAPDPTAAITNPARRRSRRGRKPGGFATRY